MAPTDQVVAHLDTQQLDDPERVKHGPLVLFLNQKEWIEPGPGREVRGVPRHAFRARTVRDILTGRDKPFVIQIRLQPPDGTDLDSWAAVVASLLGKVINKRAAPTDTALWVTFEDWVKNAPDALEGASKFFDRLAGVPFLCAQIRVVEAC